MSINKKNVFSTILSVLVSAFLVAGFVYAATTIGTNVSVEGTLAVGGNSTLTGDLAVNGGDLTTTATSWNFDLPASGGTIYFRDGTNNLVTIADGGTAGNVTITGTLGVTGASTLTGALAANGNVTLGDAVTDTVTMNAPVTLAATPSGATAWTTALNSNITSTAVGTLGWFDFTSSVTSGDVTGLRPRVKSTAASVGPNIRGTYSEAICAASGNAALLQGVLATASVAAGGCTATDVHVLAGHFSTGATAAITGDLYVGMLRQQTRGDETISGNNALLALVNEAVGGAGKQIGSAIRIFATNVTTPAAFNYGIDMSGAAGEINTADILLSNSETIANTTNGTIALGDGTNSISFTPSGTDITLRNGETIDNATDGTIQVLGGTLKSGDTNGVNAAGGRTMVYGYYKGITTALTGTGLGVRGDARQSSIDSSGTLQGGLFKAGNGTFATATDGGNLGTMTGVYAEVASTPAGGTAKTVTNARGVEINMDLNQADTDITNAYGIYMKWNAGDTATYGDITNGYGLWIDNEAVGGTGQMLDSAIFVSDTSMSGGVKGWDYGIDLNSATINTADIRLSNGETLSNTTDGGIATSGWFRVGTGTIAATPTCDATNEGLFIVFTDAANATDCSTGSGSTRNLCVCADTAWTDM